MVAQNDTSRTTTEAISVQASMISNALIELVQPSDQPTLLEKVNVLKSRTRLQIKRADRIVLI